MTGEPRGPRQSVERLLTAARSVYDHREELASDLVQSTGLSREGVVLGFESLELSATEADLRALTGSSVAAERVHVILSANVFIAPLRAILLARVAAPRVTIRPSSRDPGISFDLIRAAEDPSLEIAPELDVADIDSGEIHVYGRDETIAAVKRCAQTTVSVRAHGTGMGAVFVSRGIDCAEAARAVAEDVVPFDQRGCLSPRVAMIEGDAHRARDFSEALHHELSEFERRVPRGSLSESERHEAARWRDALCLASEVLGASKHAVAVSTEAIAPWIPPPGRHVLVVPAQTVQQAAHWLAPISEFVVALGTDDLARSEPYFPRHARRSPLGRMQHPPLDGPVDLRT